MKILSLIDQNVFVEGITMNYTNEWIEEVVVTHNIFKARDFTDEYENRDSILEEISLWVYNRHHTLVEVKEVL